MNIIQDDFFLNEECEKWITEIEGMEGKIGDSKYNLWLPEISNNLVFRCKHLLNGQGYGSGRITLVKYRENSTGMQLHTDLIREKNVKYTGIIYLNNNFGNTVLYPENRTVSIEPKKGRLVLFDVSIPHEALPPKSLKYVLIFRICED